MPTNAVYTQAQVESEILRLVDALQNECLDELRQVSEEAARAEVTYKVANAKAYLAAVGTAATRTATATVQTERELFDRTVQDRRVTVAREKLHAYQASLDSLRTILVGIRNQT